MSNFAFGTYRISEHNPQHIEALKEAIKSGITMIDTSSNYMDGSAERAIALALNSFDESVREEIEIVSKVGYIQGSNMELHKQKPYEEVVEYSPNCFHSISQSFIQDQLTRSLERLELKKLDCYLLHNPEYYILDAINKNIPKDDRLDEMYKRLYDAFLALELEVLNGRISSYGVSSNSFSKQRSDEEFLPYEDLLDLAQDAAGEIGNKKHSFTTIQLPINLLEQEGLKCASWAHKNNLRVLVNRPLNAMQNSQMHRLADYDESLSYYTYLNELLELCDNVTLLPLYNLLEQLDENKHKFGWIGDYDSFLYSQILPSVTNFMKVLDKQNRETLFVYVEKFLTELRKMVAYECSLATRAKLKDNFAECSLSMQECALKFLIHRENIDFVLVGMRKPSYVSEVLSLSIK